MHTYAYVCVEGGGGSIRGRSLIRLSRMYATPSSYANKLGRNSKERVNEKRGRERGGMYTHAHCR